MLDLQAPRAARDRIRRAVPVLADRGLRTCRPSSAWSTRSRSSSSFEQGGARPSLRARHRRGGRPRRFRSTARRSRPPPRRRRPLGALLGLGSSLRNVGELEESERVLDRLLCGFPITPRFACSSPSRAGAGVTRPTPSGSSSRRSSGPMHLEWSGTSARSAGTRPSSERAASPLDGARERGVPPARRRDWRACGLGGSAHSGRPDAGVRRKFLAVAAIPPRPVRASADSSVQRRVVAALKKALKCAT